MRRLRPIYVAYVLVFCSFFVERLLRQGESAKSFQVGVDDQGSTQAIGSAYGRAILVMLLAPLLNRLRIGWVGGERLAWCGVAATLAGTLFRAWANRVLGAY
jgi:hypothetical protein